MKTMPLGSNQPGRKLRFAGVGLAVTALVVAWVAAGPLTAPALADGTGVVAGKVSNGTPGGGNPAGSAITLVGYLGGVQAAVYRSTVASDGSYRFEGLETSAVWSYAAEIEYGGTRFSGDFLRFDGSQVVTREVRVYETTRENPGLRFVRRLVVFTPGGDRSMRVLEVATLKNPAEKAFVPARPSESLLRFSLPEAAFDFVAMWGFGTDDAELATGGVTVLAPVLPGENQVSFAYAIPWRRAGTAIRSELALPTDEFVALAPAGKVEVESDALVRAGVETVEGRELAVWRSEGPAPPGATIEISLRDPNFGPLARIGEMSSTAWGVIAVTLALGSLGAYSVWRWRRTRGARVTGPAERARELLALMAGLGVGAAAEEAQAGRQAYKDELMELALAHPELEAQLLGLPGLDPLAKGDAGGGGRTA